jgi:hypothetical protein
MRMRNNANPFGAPRVAGTFAFFFRTYAHSKPANQRICAREIIQTLFSLTLTLIRIGNEANSLSRSHLHSFM